MGGGIEEEAEERKSRDIECCGRFEVRHAVGITSNKPATAGYLWGESYVHRMCVCICDV